MYTGATGEREIALGEKVVLKFADPIKGKHHQLYFDNYFSTIRLFTKLLQQDTYACGTIRTNRKNFPSEISEETKHLQRGESRFQQCGNIVATAWKDNKVVNVVSMLSNATDSTSVNRRQKDGTRIEITCPRCIALYNQFMGGVDHGDQLRGSYHVRLKCMKNYKYIFCFLLDTAITNAYILSSFDVKTELPMDHKRFRMRLAEQLIGNYMTRKLVGRLESVPAPHPLTLIQTTYHHTRPVSVASTARRSALFHAERRQSGSALLVREVHLSA